MKKAICNRILRWSCFFGDIVLLWREENIIVISNTEISSTFLWDELVQPDETDSSTCKYQDSLSHSSCQGNICLSQYDSGQLIGDRLSVPFSTVVPTFSNAAWRQFLYFWQTLIDVPPLLLGTYYGYIDQKVHSQRYSTSICQNICMFDLYWLVFYIGSIFNQCHKHIFFLRRWKTEIVVQYECQYYQCCSVV